MKLCCLLIGVAFAIALTTPAECVPHARLARAAPAATKAPLLGLAKLLKNLSNSLPSNKSPGTGNKNLDNIAGTIVKAKVVQGDLKDKLPAENIKKLVDDLVIPLAAVSNTADSQMKLMVTAVKKAAKKCTTIDCVFDKIGASESYLDKSVVSNLEDLQKAVDKMNSTVPQNAPEINVGSLLNGFGGADPGKGLGSMLQGMGVPNDVVNGVQNAVKTAAGAGAAPGNAGFSGLFSGLKDTLGSKGASMFGNMFG